MILIDERRFSTYVNIIFPFQMGEMIVCLRREGVRRENCRKNIGKALYSFSPFQINFIPKEFRPPSGTFAQGIAS